MIVRAYLNSLLSLVKSGLIYCAAARHVDGAKKWDGKQAVDTPSSTNTSLTSIPLKRRFTRGEAVRGYYLERASTACLRPTF